MPREKSRFFVMRPDDEDGTTWTRVLPLDPAAAYGSTGEALTALKASDLEGTFQVVSIRKTVKIVREQVVRTRVEGI